MHTCLVVFLKNACCSLVGCSVYHPYWGMVSFGGCIPQLPMVDAYGSQRLERRNLDRTRKTSGNTLSEKLNSILRWCGTTLRKSRATGLNGEVVLPFVWLEWLKQFSWNVASQKMTETHPTVFLSCSFIYTVWQWRHSVYNYIRRHVGGIHVAAVYRSKLICQSKSAVCEKPWQKNDEIAAFNTVFVHIKYTSNMAARYVRDVTTFYVYVHMIQTFSKTCYYIF